MASFECTGQITYLNRAQYARQRKTTTQTLASGKIVAREGPFAGQTFRFIDIPVPMDISIGDEVVAICEGGGNRNVRSVKRL